MNKSESIAKLAEALSKAQGSMRNAVKDSDNPFFKSKYADLASVSDACRSELASNGLAITQLPEMREGKLVLSYVLMHSSGEWISGELEMNPVKSDPQGIGSAITYARRYTLAGIAGIATEDDDGNAASGNQGGNGNGRKEQAPVSFKKPAAPNSGQGDLTKDVSTSSKGSPQAAETHSTAAGPTRNAATHATAAVGEEFCTREQQDWLRLEFKNALPPKYRAQSDTIRRDLLKQEGFVKSDGQGSSTMIPRATFRAVAKKVIEYAKGLSE